jgi:3-hydroxyisobutyrate dehydrogenase-like beta-hydroxyacid dehydrogenase
MKPIVTIAFIGLGNMGVPMAAQLAAKGFILALYDQRADAVRDFVAAYGGRAAVSIIDAASGADAAIVMLRRHRTGCRPRARRTGRRNGARHGYHRHEYIQPDRHD